MMALKDLETLLRSLMVNGIDTCDIRQADGERLRLRLASTAVSTPSPEPAELNTPSGQTLVSNGMGVYFRRHPFLAQDGGSVLDLGNRVEEGDVIGFLLTGDIVQTVSAGTAGIILAVLVQDGELVGYGQPLYRLQ